MDPKQTNWAEMPSDEDLSPHGNQKQENPILDESLPNQETTQVSMARNYKRKPQLTSILFWALCLY